MSIQAQSVTILFSEEVCIGPMVSCTYICRAPIYKEFIMRRVCCPRAFQFPRGGVLLLALVYFVHALWPSAAAAAVPAATTEERSLRLDPQVLKFLQSAEEADKRGNADVALIELKNAVRLAPQNGEVRARLGIMLLRLRQTI